MKCRVCGDKFHYCSSCDPDMFYENEYCSQKCFEASDEFIKIRQIHDSLTESEVELLIEFGCRLLEEYHYRWSDDDDDDED